jgi:hypothetical protein
VTAPADQSAFSAFFWILAGMTMGAHIGASAILSFVLRTGQTIGNSAVIFGYHDAGMLRHTAQMPLYRGLPMPV